MPAITDLDVDDDAELRAFWEVEQQAQRADRSHPVLWTWERRVQMLRPATPPGLRRRVLLTAYDGRQLVGVCELSGPTRDNLHLAELEVNVLPSHRRRGIGRALLEEAVRRGRDDGRHTFIGEATQPAADGSSAGVAFAEAAGFTSAHREDHLIAELPFAPDRLSSSAAGHAVRTWTNHAPDDLVAPYARMNSQMNADVPIGELDLEPREVTVADVRDEEQRLGRSYDTVVAVAQRGDGELDGYTRVFLPHGEDYVQQDDTFVVRSARGHGLARALKVEVLALVQREHPRRTLVHTWTALDNEPMQRLNRGLGFRPVELMHEMQRRDR